MLVIHVAEQETTQNNSNNTTWNSTKGGGLRTLHCGHESWEILTEVFGEENCLLLRLRECKPLHVPTEESSQPDLGWWEVGEL